MHAEEQTEGNGAPPESTMTNILNGKRVLVVDDQATPRMLVAAGLEHAGMAVVQADSGDAALDAVRGEHVDAFVLDINMPGLSGIELCRVLRATPAHRRSPVIFVTGMEATEMLQWALDAGGDDFIRKPVHSVVLRARLKSLLERATYLEELELRNESLQQYLSPRTRELIRTHAETGLLPAPERVDLCALFVDARELAEDETLAPEALLQVLGRRLDTHAACILRYDGHIERRPGDSLLATFTGPQRALLAARCALAIRARDIESGGPGCRIGLHAGPAVIGNSGSGRRFDYSVVGLTLNIAARLCGHAAPSTVLATRAVRDLLEGDPRFAWADPKAVAIRGARDAMEIAELTPGA